MFILNQERNKAINIEKTDIIYISVRNKSINVLLDQAIYDEEWIGEFKTEDQAKAEMYRLIKCLSDGHELFIVSNPKDLLNVENS